MEVPSELRILLQTCTFQAVAADVNETGTFGEPIVLGSNDKL